MLVRTYRFVCSFRYLSILLMMVLDVSREFGRGSACCEFISTYLPTCLYLDPTWFERRGLMVSDYED